MSSHAHLKRFHGNRPGRRLQPDGYTLLVGGPSNIIFNARMYEKAPHDPLKQLGE